MKKAISIVLTVVMLFAVCIPVFAMQDISETGSGNLTVTTLTTTEDGKNAADYSVSIPADTDIAWGTPSTDVGYYVESHLKRNQAVRVVVSGSLKMKTDPANGEPYSIAYTLGGDGVDYTAGHPVVYEAEKQEVNVLIDSDVWNRAVVESYSDVLTYTSEVVTVTA